MTQEPHLSVMAADSFEGDAESTVCRSPRSNIVGNDSVRQPLDFRRQRSSLIRSFEGPAIPEEASPSAPKISQCVYPLPGQRCSCLFPFSRPSYFCVHHVCECHLFRSFLRDVSEGYFMPVYGHSQGTTQSLSIFVLKLGQLLTPFDVDEPVRACLYYAPRSCYAQPCNCFAVRPDRWLPDSFAVQPFSFTLRFKHHTSCFRI